MLPQPSALKSNWLVLTTVFIVALDQLLKFYMVSERAAGISYNPAVSFGLGNSDWYWAGVATIIIMAGLYKLRPYHIWVSLIVAVLGTGLDRYYYGAVVDHLHIWRLSFNLTDIVIVALIGYLGLRIMQKEAA